HGYYTIDQFLGMVPDCLASFEDATFPFIKDNSIEEIYFEGGRFMPTETFMNEMKRILVDGGIVEVDDESIGRYEAFSKKANELVFNSKITSNFRGYPDFFGWNDVFASRPYLKY